MMMILEQETCERMRKIAPEQVQVHKIPLGQECKSERCSKCHYSARLHQKLVPNNGESAIGIAQAATNRATFSSTLRASTTLPSTLSSPTTTTTGKCAPLLVLKRASARRHPKSSNPLPADDHPSTRHATSVWMSSLNVVAVASILSCIALLSNAAEDPKKLLDNLQTFESCIVPAGYSFVYKEYPVPTSMDEMRSACKRQQDAIKCIKDRTKSSPGLVRRSMVAYASARQRHHKKYCTNLASQQSRDFVAAMSCVVNKSLDKYARADSIFANSIEEIKRLNMNDSATELKQICCTLYKLKRAQSENAKPDCASSQTIIDEMIDSVIPNDINMLCEEEDKMLTKVCPFLEPLKNVDRPYDPRAGKTKMSTSALTIYLVLTLGEPE